YLLPGDVRHVAGERDVGSRRVVHGVRDRLTGVEELEVIAADQSRDEDGVLALAELLLPDHPRHGRAAGLERAGGDARVPGVAASLGVERARVLGGLGLAAVAEAVHARGVEDVGLAGRSGPARDPTEAAAGRGT